MDLIKNIFKDPSLFKAILNDPKEQNYIQNNSILTKSTSNFYLLKIFKGVKI